MAHTDEKSLLQIGYLTPVERLSAEHEAALRWLDEDATEIQVVAASPPRWLEALDVLWVHLPDNAAYKAFRSNRPLAAALKTYAEQGGRLLLTNHAAFLPHDLGFETRRPEARPHTITDDGFGRAFGFQSFRGHPVLDAFHGGTALWHADADHTAWRVGYFDAAWPAAGRVGPPRGPRARARAGPPS